MSITAKELAKILNISEAAVSMALNNKPGVSTATKRKIVNCAKEHGYDFSRLKEVESKSNSNGSILFIIYQKNGVVVDDTPFYSKLSEGISQSCRECNYTLTIAYFYHEDDISAQIKLINQSNHKGVLLLGTEMNEIDFEPFKTLRHPIVVLDTCFESIYGNYVLIDNVRGASSATDYLIKTFKTQPGYLKSKYEIANFYERTDGFYRAIRKNGMSTSRSIVHNLSPSTYGAYADMKDYIEQGEELASCYFADNDLIAAGALKAFKDSGYRVPEDIAIIGFDDMPHCIFIEPQLSTVRVPKTYFGNVAAKRLFEVIHSQTTDTTKILINTSLVLRTSSKRITVKTHRNF